ncbi:MAG: ShlB/FhaC/HecB family hemolysin secretion/activation protein [Pseudomonadota bacterium]
MRTTSIGAVLCVCASLSAVDQTAAQNARQFLDDRQTQIEEARPKPQAGRIATPSAVISAPEGASDIDLTLASITLVGPNDRPITSGEGLPLDQARAIYQSKIGQQITLADVYGIAEDIDRSLKRSGFLFTRVLVPEQEFDRAGAKVKLRLLGTTVDQVSVEEPEGPIGPVKSLIQRMVQPLAGKKNPNIADLERVSLLVSDLPGIVRATFVPSPGDQPNTVDLSMNVVRQPFNAVGIVSYRDSPTIGPGVFGGIGYLNTYAPFGASTEISYFNSWGFEASDFGERNTVELTQRFFFETGTEVNFSGFLNRTKPGDVLEDLQISGDQLVFGLQVEHPVLRSRQASFWINAGFEWIDSEVDFGGNAITLTDDSSRVIELGARGEVIDPFGETKLQLSLRKGLDILGATEEGDPDVSRAGASGDFFVIRGEVFRDQPLFGNFSANLRMVGQWADDTVLSSETLSLGGARYLKGYDPSEVQGDRGFASYLELRYADSASIRDLNLRYQLYTFGDHGFVMQANGPDDKTDLTSTGFGTRVSVPRGPTIELELARPVGAPRLRTGDKDIRVFGSMVWFF